MSVSSVGIDLGSSKTVIIADDGELVLTSTGSVSRPSVICFNGRSRLVDEEAMAQTSADSIVRSFNLYLDQNIDNTMADSVASSDDNNRVMWPIQYNDECKDMSIVSLLGMFLVKQNDRINEVYNNEKKVNLSFVLPPNATSAAATTIKQACCVAGIELDRVCTTNKAEALKIAYTRKAQALQPNERTALEGKDIVIIDMGNTQTTALLISLPEDSLDSKKVPLFGSGGPFVKSSCYEANLGAAHFDKLIFKHFADICEKKHQTTVSLNSRRGKRLINGCERVRKLLSQLPEASITVENLTDNGDVNFKLTRDELLTLGSDLLSSFRNMLVNNLLSGMSASDIANIGGVEILGGGSRMTVVQTVICEIFRDNKNINNVTGPGTTATSTINAHKALGAKLDDGSIALGAALIANNQLIDTKLAISDDNNYITDSAIFSPLGKFAAEGLAAPENVVGFTSDEVQNMINLEQEMLTQDNEIVQLLDARNDLEAFLLDCRGFKRQKYGTAAYMDITALDKIIDDHENWMYDEPDASLNDVKSKFNNLRQEVQNNICKKYFEAIDKDRQEVEAQLAIEAEKAAAEKAANPDEDQDVDNRKLKKADRMRLVMKNKDEATEIFKGGVYKTACARYSKALTHCTKFFDLSADDEAEVKQLKISLYLNIALCYLKMEKNEQVLNNCNHALELDPRNPKAYFRRSAAWEAKKDLQNALKDAKQAQGEMVIPDKAINATVGRLTKAIAAEKKAQQKTWGKAFS